LEFLAISKFTRADFPPVLSAGEAPREIGDAKLVERNERREFCWK
jgi:hypothetical protein